MKKVRKLALILHSKIWKDFTQESIAKSVPELNGLLELREALVALKAL